MVNPSHSVAGKTYTPELVHEDTGRQAQQSCIQYGVAPAANGDHAVVALHDRASSPRIWAVLQHSGLTGVCSTRDQADQQGSHCRSQVETTPMTRPTSTTKENRARDRSSDGPDLSKHVEAARHGKSLSSRISLSLSSNLKSLTTTCYTGNSTFCHRVHRRHSLWNTALLYDPVYTNLLTLSSETAKAFYDVSIISLERDLTDSEDSF